MSMYKLVTNDSTAYPLAALPFESILKRKGVSKKVICFTFGKEIDTIAAVKAICQDELKTAVLTVYENEVEVRTINDYTVLEQISTAFVEIDGEEVEVLEAKMSLSTTIPEQIATLEDLVNTLQGENKTLAGKVETLSTANTELKESLAQMAKYNETVTSNASDIDIIKTQLNLLDEDELDLEGLKDYRIATSKVNLANYLATNTVKSTAHAGVEAEYSMTQEKQSQLMAVIMMASLNPEYTPSWNATGEVCTYDWTLDELQALAADIEAVVRPLVSKQQEIEVEIRNAETIEAVKAIDITF